MPKVPHATEIGNSVSCQKKKSVGEKAKLKGGSGGDNVSCEPLKSTRGYGGRPGPPHTLKTRTGVQTKEKIKSCLEGSFGAQKKHVAD